MLPKVLISRIENHLKAHITGVTQVPGGCISGAFKIELEDAKPVFFKFNPNIPQLFQAEADGLIELAQANEIRVPKVLVWEDDMLILEFLESTTKRSNFFSDFGKKMARLHRHSNNEYGFYRDNFCGSTPQKNKFSKNWIEFFFEHRLQFQYRLAEFRGHVKDDLKAGMKFIEKNIHRILEGSDEKPALIHGDLWSGNFVVDDKGEAAIIDPAVYYGHREADLAMTRMFGGFDDDFYTSYNEEFPLLEGYEFREQLYILYHVLNHLNLSGPSYYPQAMSILKYYKKALG